MLVCQYARYRFRVKPPQRLTFRREIQAENFNMAASLRRFQEVADVGDVSNELPDFRDVLQILQDYGAEPVQMIGEK